MTHSNIGPNDLTVFYCRACHTWWCGEDLPWADVDLISLEEATALILAGSKKLITLCGECNRKAEEAETITSPFDPLGE